MDPETTDNLTCAFASALRRVSRTTNRRFIADSRMREEQVR